MQLQLTILGSSSAVPSYGRGLTSQILQTETHAYLIDCGEGTQFNLKAAKIKISKIDHIFISHLHGDHVFGLAGLLSSMSMQGRVKQLKMFGPPGLSHLIETIFEYAATHIGFDLLIDEIDTKTHKKIFSDRFFDVFSLPLEHRVPTAGFKFVENLKALKIKSEIIDKLGLNYRQIQDLKKGRDIVLQDGYYLKSADACFESRERRSFAYVSDTAYCPGLIQQLRGIHLLFHEATYLHNLKELAAERMHSTAVEAATIAKNAGVKQLILGHFSSRYKKLDLFLTEAREIFPATSLGLDGSVFSIE